MRLRCFRFRVTRYLISGETTGKKEARARTSENRGIKSRRKKGEGGGGGIKDRDKGVRGVSRSGDRPKKKRYFANGKSDPQIGDTVVFISFVF